LLIDSSRVNKIMVAWQEASDDKYFQQAQDEIYARTTYKPAQEKLESYGVDMSKLTTLSYLTIINIYVLEGATGSNDEKGGDDFVDDIFGRDDFDSEQFNNDLDYQLGIVTEFFNHYTSVDGQSITQHRKDTIKELLKMAKNNYHIATDLTLDQVFDIYQETDPDKNY